MPESRATHGQRRRRDAGVVAVGARDVEGRRRLRVFVDAGFAVLVRVEAELQRGMLLRLRVRVQAVAFPGGVLRRRVASNRSHGLGMADLFQDLAAVSVTSLLQNFKH